MAILGGWRITRAGILFIVGILVLGGLVTGGIFLVKNHGEAVRRDEAVKVAEQNLKNQSEVATQPVKSDNSDQQSTEAAHTDTDTTTATASTDAAQLPATGFDDAQGIERVIIVSILALSVAFYVASRRASSRL